jgi:hypothetical protein
MVAGRRKACERCQKRRKKCEQEGEGSGVALVPKGKGKATRTAPAGRRKREPSVMSLGSSKETLPTIEVRRPTQKKERVAFEDAPEDADELTAASWEAAKAFGEIGAARDTGADEVADALDLVGRSIESVGRSVMGLAKAYRKKERKVGEEEIGFSGKLVEMAKAIHKMDLENFGL